MNVLCLQEGNTYHVEEFPAIGNMYRDIEQAKKALDAFEKYTYVACFTDEGWLISDFNNQTMLEELTLAYRSAKNGLLSEGT